MTSKWIRRFLSWTPGALPERGTKKIRNSICKDNPDSH